MTPNSHSTSAARRSAGLLEPGADRPPRQQPLVLGAGPDRPPSHQASSAGPDRAERRRPTSAAGPRYRRSTSHTTIAASTPKPNAQQREPAVAGDELLGLRLDEHRPVVGHPHRHGGRQAAHSSPSGAPSRRRRSRRRASTATDRRVAATGSPGTSGCVGRTATERRPPSGTARPSPASRRLDPVRVGPAPRLIGPARRGAGAPARRPEARHGRRLVAGRSRRRTRRR